MDVALENPVWSGAEGARRSYHQHVTLISQAKGQSILQAVTEPDVNQGIVPFDFVWPFFTEVRCGHMAFLIVRQSYTNLEDAIATVYAIFPLPSLPPSSPREEGFLL